MSRLAICLLLAGDVVGPANEFSICFKMSIVSSEKGKKGEIKYVFVTVVCFLFSFFRGQFAVALIASGSLHLAIANALISTNQLRN